MQDQVQTINDWALNSKMVLDVTIQKNFTSRRSDNLGELGTGTFTKFEQISKNSRYDTRFQSKTSSPK